MNGADLVNRWFEKSADDLIAAKHVFDNVHPKLIEIACYHCQQTVEKAIKGFLQYHDIKPPHTHNLTMLCQMCSEIDTSFQNIQDICSTLSTYATTTRYPDDDIEITEENARFAIKKAETIFTFCANLVYELEQGQTQETQ
jgi:HEPN domain-containing protein